MTRVILLLVLLGVSDLSTAAAPEAAEADTLPRAQAAAQDFSTRLRQALQQEMATHGAAASVDFCRVQAPKIAEAVMAEYDVRLGRVAVPWRNRNPANAPLGWQAAALSQFQMMFDHGVPAADLSFVQRDNLPADTQLRLIRGIAVEQPCLACHGRKIAAPVAQAIVRNYPNDGATGFDVGELRGALWVEVPATKTEKRR